MNKRKITATIEKHHPTLTVLVTCAIMTAFLALFAGCRLVSETATTPAHYEVAPAVGVATNSIIATGNALAPATNGLSSMLGEFIAYIVGTGATIITGLATHKLIKSHTKVAASNSPPTDGQTS